MQQQEGPRSTPEEVKFIPGFFVPEVNISRYGGSVAYVDLLASVWRRWRWVLGTVCVFLLGAVAIALLATPQFRAEITLVPAPDERLNAGASSQLRGIASLVGVGLPTSSNRGVVALALLRSDGFAARFLQRNNIVSVILKEDWAEEEKIGPPSRKTLNEAVRRFDRGVRFVNEDDRTGLVKVAIQWEDPTQAADWANRLVFQLNEEMRQRALKEASQSVEYLEGQLATTDFLEVRQAIHTLIEEQTKAAMYAHVREEYAYQVIDHAGVPDKPTSPRPLLLAALAIVIGGIAGVLVATVRDKYAIRQ